MDKEESVNPESITGNVGELVLFTGGRDSTLTASLYMLREVPVLLLSADSGCSVHQDVKEYRFNEFRRRFGDHLFQSHHMDIAGTFRFIALQNIEQDILKYKKNLIVAGEKLAILVHAVDYCLRHNFKSINVGYTKYQIEFPEQREKSIAFYKSFLKGYGIEFKTPIYNDADSIEYVKYKLMQLGLSNKPLEGSTLFGDTFSTASDETIEQYLLEKEEIAHSQVEFLTQGLASMKRS